MSFQLQHGMDVFQGYQLLFNYLPINLYSERIHFQGEATWVVGLPSNSDRKSNGRGWKTCRELWGNRSEKQYVRRPDFLNLCSYVLFAERFFSLQLVFLQLNSSIVVTLPMINSIFSFPPHILPSFLSLSFPPFCLYKIHPKQKTCTTEYESLFES